MLWLILQNESHQIDSCNLHTKENGLHQVWVTKVGGKGLLVGESKERKEVELIKKAIDYAIEMNESVLRL